MSNLVNLNQYGMQIVGVVLASIIMNVVQFLLFLVNLDYTMGLIEAALSPYKIMLEIVTLRGTRIYRVPRKDGNVMFVLGYGGFIENPNASLLQPLGVRMYTVFEGRALPPSIFAMYAINDIHNWMELFDLDKEKRMDYLKRMGLDDFKNFQRTLSLELKEHEKELDTEQVEEVDPAPAEVLGENEVYADEVEEVLVDETE